MRQVTFGFSKPKGNPFPWFSWLIRLVDNAPFSHVYMKLKTKYDCDLIYQASGVQVNFMSERIFNSHAETLYTFESELSDEAYGKLMKFCIVNAGAPYSIKQIFAILIYKLTGKKVYPCLEGFVCSEIAGIVIKDFFNFKINDVDYLTPKDVFKMFREIQHADA